MAKGEVPAELLARVRARCAALPEAHEEEAWTGTRWRVRKRTFAHVLLIEDGWPPAYARAAGTDGPAVVLTFRSSPAEREALRSSGPPYFVPEWGRDDAGLLLDGGTDWAEVAELVTESYRLLAPRALARQIVEDGVIEIEGFDL